MEQTRQTGTFSALKGSQQAHRIASDIQNPELKVERPDEPHVRWYVPAASGSLGPPAIPDAAERPAYHEHPFTPVELPEWLKKQHQAIDGRAVERQAARVAAVVVAVLFGLVIALIVYLHMSGQIR